MPCVAGFRHRAAEMKSSVEQSERSAPARLVRVLVSEGLFQLPGEQLRQRCRFSRRPRLRLSQQFRVEAQRDVLRHLPAVLTSCTLARKSVQISVALCQWPDAMVLFLGASLVKRRENTMKAAILKSPR